MKYFNKANWIKTNPETGREKPRTVKMVVHTILWVFILVTLVTQFPFGTVGAGERGVQLRFNAVTHKIFDEGLYFRIPYTEKVVKMDVQIGKVETEADAASKDLQSVDAIIALNFHLQPESVATIYQEVRKDYGFRIIAPAIQEGVKAATAQFTAEELITKRQEARDVMAANIKAKLSERGIAVDAFNIINFQFSQVFDTAIEKKVTAEQDALAAKNKLEQIKFEAQQKVAEAKGKAEALNIEGRALRSNPQVVELRAIEKWDGVMPKVTGGAVPFVNID